jgi:hypothetical protein
LDIKYCSPLLHRQGIAGAKRGGEYVSESVQITLIFCTTIVAIVGIVAMVVYNRDNIAVKVQTKANIVDKAKTEFSVEIKDKEN